MTDFAQGNIPHRVSLEEAFCLLFGGGGRGGDDYKSTSGKDNENSVIVSVECEDSQNSRDSGNIPNLHDSESDREQDGDSAQHQHINNSSYNNNNNNADVNEFYHYVCQGADHSYNEQHKQHVSEDSDGNDTESQAAFNDFHQSELRAQEMMEYCLSTSVTLDHLPWVEGDLVVHCDSDLSEIAWQIECYPDPITLDFPIPMATTMPMRTADIIDRTSQKKKVAEMRDAYVLYALRQLLTIRRLLQHLDLYVPDGVLAENRLVTYLPGSEWTRRELLRQQATHFVLLTVKDVINDYHLDRIPDDCKNSVLTLLSVYKGHVFCGGYYGQEASALMEVEWKSIQSEIWLTTVEIFVRRAQTQRVAYLVDHFTAYLIAVEKREREEASRFYPEVRGANVTRAPIMAPSVAPTVVPDVASTTGSDSCNNNNNNKRKKKSNNSKNNNNNQIGNVSTSQSRRGKGTKR